MSDADDPKSRPKRGRKSEPERPDAQPVSGQAEAAAQPDQVAAAQVADESEEPIHIRTARRFWVLSIVNWAIAIICWGVSSYLGVARPTSMFVYTILFVVGLVAVIVGFVCWLVARFGTEPMHRAPEGGGAR